jgi:Phosphotransferase enzyme family
MPNNPIGVPFIMMEAVKGLQVSETWFDNSGQIPLHTRRLRTLETLAAAMSQLSCLSFDLIGSLEGSMGDNFVTEVNGCVIVDEFNDIDSRADFAYRQVGPFISTRDYFQSLLDLQVTCANPYSKGRRHLLELIIQSMPNFDDSIPTGQKRFVLAHPDLDSQNVLVSDDGTVTCILDWDTVHAFPRCIGYSRYPGWITRDWEPLRYGYGLENSCLENSPDELEEYRRFCTERISHLLPMENYTSKSHLFEAILIAVSSEMSSGGIIHKIFELAFPQPNDPDDNSSDRTTSPCQHNSDSDNEASNTKAIPEYQLEEVTSVQIKSSLMQDGNSDKSPLAHEMPSAECYATFEASNYWEDELLNLKKEPVDPDISDETEDMPIYYNDVVIHLAEGTAEKGTIDALRMKFRELLS